jgi:hypothetical protein
MAEFIPSAMKKYAIRKLFYQEKSLGFNEQLVRVV